MKAMSPNGILKDNFLINGTLVAANRVRQSFRMFVCKYEMSKKQAFHNNPINFIGTYVSCRNDFTIVPIGERGSPLRMNTQFSSY